MRVAARACPSSSRRRCAIRPRSNDCSAGPPMSWSSSRTACCCREPFLQTPRLGCINIHASLLPRWRGAAPIQRAMLAGDARDRRDDHADGRRPRHRADAARRAQRRSMQRETAASLHDRLATLGAQALLDGARRASRRARAMPRAQPADGVTYAPKIRKEEALIDWSRTAVEIDRQVRAFNPWPIAETRWKGQQLRVWEAVPHRGDRVAAAPATVIASERCGHRRRDRRRRAAADARADCRAARRCPQRSSSTRIGSTARCWAREPLGCSSCACGEDRRARSRCAAVRSTRRCAIDRASDSPGTRPAPLARATTAFAGTCGSMRCSSACSTRPGQKLDAGSARARDRRPVPAAVHGDSRARGRRRDGRTPRVISGTRAPPA